MGQYFPVKGIESKTTISTGEEILIIVILGFMMIYDELKRIAFDWGFSYSSRCLHFARSIVTSIKCYPISGSQNIIRPNRRHK